MSINFIDCPQSLAELYNGDLMQIVPELKIYTGDLSRSRMMALLADSEFVMNDHTYMDQDFLLNCKNLKAIVFLGTGASSFIDVEAATRQGIRVRTVKGYGDRSVAEHAIALMFSAGRRVAEMDRSLRNGVWDTLNSIEFLGKKLGVVGTGGIGSEVVRIGSALGMDCLLYTSDAADD